MFSSLILFHFLTDSLMSAFFLQLTSQLILRLKEASNAKGFEHWPVIGGQKNRESCAAVVQHSEFHDLIAIAHADADVSLWHVVRGDCYEFLGRISTLAMMADVGEICCHAERKVSRQILIHLINNLLVMSTNVLCLM